MRSPGMPRPVGSIKCSLGRVRLPQPITLARPTCYNDGITGNMKIKQAEPADVSTDNSNLPAEVDGTPRTPSFLELPIEMLAQICAYLHPLDLRNLSLTNNALRRILMSREARQMWKAAQVGSYNDMPGCPLDISEPKYTCLVFVSECFTCDAIATTIDLFNRTKLCAECHKKSHLTKAQVNWQYRKFPRELRFPPDEVTNGVERPYCKSRMKADNDNYQNLGAADERAAYKVVLATRSAYALESARAIHGWMRGERYKQMLESVQAANKTTK